MCLKGITCGFCSLPRRLGMKTKLRVRFWPRMGWSSLAVKVVFVRIQLSPSHEMRGWPSRGSYASLISTPSRRSRAGSGRRRCDRTQGGREMPVKRRNPKARRFVVTPETLALWRICEELLADGSGQSDGENREEYLDLSSKFSLALGLTPWDHSPFF